ncbi:MAG: hypothetical protein Q7R43_05225 [Candidatus Daviesbacteria bacterium]|nr:hypothetical protein [Candidatus Daviesbacteria bacterium]
MNKKVKLFILILIIILVTAFLVVKINKRPVYKKGSSGVYDNAIAAAISLYSTRVKEGLDMSKGPCLTNDLMPGWVVDIVHVPREEIDNLPGNGCQAYLEGRARNFIELDTNGNLVRIR